MKKILILLFCFSAFEINAQTPDWSSKVASILYSNCTVCHHDGAIAPFSLMTYDDAVANGINIQIDVNSKKMPPWPADPNYNHYWNERVLSDDDITAINDWVNAGMPSGDLSSAPVPPVYNGGATMLNPDDTIQIPKFTITNDSNVYRSFVIHSNYTETKYINEFEFIPGDWSIVHHTTFNADTADIAYLKDLADTLPGFDTGGGGNGFISNTSVDVGAWLPGNGIFKLPSNMGIEIPPGADIIISIHYSPGSMGKVDSSKLFFKFCSAPDSSRRRVYRTKWLFLAQLVNGPFIIPANVVKTFNEVTTPGVHKSMLGLTPHSHHVCTSWRVRMVTSPGDTTNLLYIPKWSFYWQYNYMLTKVMEVPFDATLLGEAVFDNTVNNPDNPNNPPKMVKDGGESGDEMMSCGFVLMDYQTGDENIILDSAFYGLPTSQFSVAEKLPLNIYPNPANGKVNLVSDLPAHNVSWQLTDLFGVVVKSNKVKNVSKGIYTEDIDVSTLTVGLYQLSIQSGDKVAVKKITVVR
ncbi:MAG: T9SS type A sorting domain-containing protein [Chitinophagales bacterium]|nr:T9SS type A sorting domain-containing protein [Chitinophagales bacterium]